MFDNDSTEMKRSKYSACIKESNFSCSYTHIMVVNARNIFVCETKKKCGSTQFFLNFIDFPITILGVGVKMKTTTSEKNVYQTRIIRLLLKI